MRRLRPGWVAFPMEGGVLLLPEATVLAIEPTALDPRPMVYVPVHPLPPGWRLAANGAWEAP